MKALNLLFTLLVFAVGIDLNYGAQMVCYYDSESFARTGLGHLSMNNLEPALEFCNFLVYGYAGVDPNTYQITPLNQSLDVMRNHYRTITNLKRSHSNVQVLLSVGGDRDAIDPVHGNHYLRLLDEPAHRQSFINSVVALLKTHNFDGLDLAWQFPKSPPRIDSRFKKVWQSIKNWFAGRKSVEDIGKDYNPKFVIFLRELNEAIRRNGFMLTLTILPNVDSSIFIDIPNVVPFVDFVNLGTFDFQTPYRNPKEADMTAPLYQPFEREPDHNINYQVEHWLNNSAPANKINIGIPAFGRTWIMTRDSGITGYPPIPDANGPAPGGRYTQTPGLLSWPEICDYLHRKREELVDDEAALKKVGDPLQRYGTYAYRAADENGDFGMWVGYEEPMTAAVKAGYVYAKFLGGVALFDLSLDDFRGECAGEKFPILRSIKFKM